MEEQLAALTAELAAIKSSAGVTNTMTAELFYYLTIPLMVLIHAGFLAYEMGASRHKNVLSSGIKNILAFAYVVPAFFFVGWWIYWAFPTGLTLSEGANGISGAGYANSIALPWVEFMGPNIADNASGVFWGAFALFSATTASIFSGAVIERIQTTGFIVLAIALGAFLWVFAAAWGWHADGWLVTQFGFHDFGAAGVVHTVAGFFALGVLINLGPRIGKFNKDGTANDLSGHNMPFTITGLMLIIVGFWGFLMACAIFPGEGWSWFGDKFATIYGTPMTLSALAFNVLMAFSGGIIGAWVFTRDPFWMMSGALAGIIATASGLDVYWPPLAFVVALSAGLLLKPAASLLERFGIDDAVGAVTVHGTIGVYGCLMFGIVGMGFPALQGEGAPTVNFFGQAIGAGVCVLLGLVPGYLISLLLKGMGLLRVSEAVELKGLDPSKVPAQAYPEGMPSSAPASD